MADTGGPCAPSQACWSPASLRPWWLGPEVTDPGRVPGVCVPRQAVHGRAGSRLGSGTCASASLPWALPPVCWDSPPALLVSRLCVCPPLSSATWPCFLCCVRLAGTCGFLPSVPSFSVHVSTPVLLLLPGPRALSWCGEPGMGCAGPLGPVRGAGRCYPAASVLPVLYQPQRPVLSLAPQPCCVWVLSARWQACPPCLGRTRLSCVAHPVHLDPCDVQTAPLPFVSWPVAESCPATCRPALRGKQWEGAGQVRPHPGDRAVQGHKTAAATAQPRVTVWPPWGPAGWVSCGVPDRRDRMSLRSENIRTVRQGAL